ncbi:uncharacterized protein LOC128875318 [Hylaeus volcanicus]|uniref:uncharacterized protein LOC128875318 n=1 Tax=Hylaeus volcanicus TaxID=313075 RepID=UPI0023B80C53|nr:uncharacterized protein LOC128875318 [Hylaeus volcanicus]
MDIDLLKLSNSLWKRETPKTSNISKISTSQNPLAVEEEPITGKNEVEDEVILLNKRQAWKRENEEQLEEVAFGEDMRKGLKDKELFEKLTEIDKEKSLSGSDAENKRKDGNAETNVSPISSNTRRDNDLEIKYEDCVSCNRNSNDSLSEEDKLRILEERINVYSDR